MNDTTTLMMSTSKNSIPEEVYTAQTIRSVYIWVLVAVGVPGNLACLVTVLSMHVTTATFYVALLAAADTVALLVKLLFHQLVTYKKLTTAACYFSFLVPFFSCYANWVLALICFERFFAVCFPLKKQVCFTKGRVHISVVVLTVALAVCFVPKPVFVASVSESRGFCVEKTMFAEARKVFYEPFVSSLYFFLPFVLIAVFTTLIIVGLQRHRRARQRMSMVVSAGGGGASDGAAERSISIMLLSAGLVFLMLMLPVCLFHLFIKQSYDLDIPQEKAKAFLWYQICTVLSDTNHALNFIIYFLSAAKFRKRFFEMVKRGLGLLWCRPRRPSCSAEDVTHLTQMTHSQEAKNTPDPASPAS